MSLEPFPLSPSPASPGLQTLSVQHISSWMERWQRPRGKMAVKAWLFLIGLILVAGGIVFAVGGTAYAWVQLMYVPIIVGSAIFGLRGGLITAIIAGLVVGPFMPQDIGQHQTAGNWLLRAFFFLIIGGCSGLISSWAYHQLERLRRTHLELLEAHEELKTAQLQLIQNAKMESIGRLSAGVAHEVKNPLAVIQLGIDYLGGAIKDNSDVTETIQDMDDAVKRADTVIKGLLDFSRNEQLVLVPYDLNKLIEETLLLIKHEITKNHVTLEKHLQEGLPLLALDRNKLKQVFINLFMNSIQSMGASGGMLAVSTRREPVRGQKSPFQDGDEVVVAQVEDTGAGIPPDKLDKLFEPFFTTKAAGRGTGLGLSVSRKIIELHGGTIKLANRQTKGAIALITFKTQEKH